MNGITESILNCYEEMQQYESIEWTHIDSLCTVIQHEYQPLGEALSRLFSLIKGHYKDELKCAKEIIDYKSEMYDAILAKVQSIEDSKYAMTTQQTTVNEQVKNTNEEEEEDLNELEASFLKAISGNQIVIDGLSEAEEEECEFAFEYSYQSSENEKKKIRFVVQKNQSIHINKKETAKSEEEQNGIINSYKTEIENLRSQNVKYMNIGFEWKNKYRATNIKMQEMAENHMREMKKLYSLVESLPQQRN